LILRHVKIFFSLASFSYNENGLFRVEGFKTRH